jgi:hypothetical protein
MNKTTIIDLFAEDKAHEAFLKATIARFSSQFGILSHIRVISARGGHGKAISEYSLYQGILEKNMLQTDNPDIMVIAIDCNCKGPQKMVRSISECVHEKYQARTVYACPDPHIERWYLSDPDAIKNIIGASIQLPRKKCNRDFYKRILADVVKKAGHPPSLGGIEFADELVNEMDFYRAGKAENSLNLFVKSLAAALKRTAGI